MENLYKVTATRLNIRSAPMVTAAIVGALPMHDLVAVTAEVDGWAQTHRGWVSMKFLQPANVPQTLANTLLGIARSQIGLTEIPKGSNWGQHVEKYLASVGIGFPAAWCMAFVYWCVNKAADEMKVANPLFKTGGVMAQWNASKALRVKTPQRGDIFIMDFGKGLGHTGIVESVQGDRIMTIEGNSNSQGSRDGVEVCRKPGGRLITSCKGFLRI